MKKLLLLFFFSIFFLNSQGQTSVYHPFPDSNAVWTILYQTTNVPFGCSSWLYEENYSYIFSNDTIIKGIAYHKLIKPFTWSSCYLNSHGYVGSIRQNTVSKKVFIVYPFDSIEHTLYDFNLKAGDTIIDWRCGNDSIVKVNYVDSTLIGSDYHKTWNLSHPNSPPDSVLLIEGIGLQTGLLEGYHCPGIIESYAYSLVCFKQNGKTLYPDSTISLLSLLW